MRRHLRESVRIEIFPGREMPPPTSRQYFPTKKDIYNHMYRAMVKSRFSNCDQTNAEEKVKEWQMQTPNDKFFFRKYSVTHLWCKIWEKYHSAVNDLLTSDIWKHSPKLRHWFGNKWLKSKEVIFILMMSQTMLFILQVLMDIEVNESNWTTTILTVMQSNIYNVAQHAKKVVSDSPG